MSVRSFLDTNVLVYAFDADEPEKRQRSLDLLEDPPDGTTFVLSTQVLQEFYAVVTRKLARPLPEERAETAVLRLSELPVVDSDVGLVLAAIRLSRTEQLSLWDALIVGAAVAGGCQQLLTEDLQHGRVLRGVEVINPYLEEE